MTLKLLKLWLLLLAVASVGSAQAALTTSVIKISCVGDSITYGYLLPNQPTQCYPAVLGQMLGKGYQVGNFGVSARCINKKGQYPYCNETAFQQSLAFQPNIVVIQLGTNDLADVNWPYFSTFVADYEDLIAQYEALPTHPLIYVCLPPPIFGDYGYGYSNARQQQLLPQIRQVASDTGATLIDNYTVMNAVPQDFSNDTIHPNVDGAVRLAGNVFLSVAPPGSAAPNIINDNDPSIYYSAPITGAAAGNLLGGFAYDQNGTTGNIRDDLHVSRTYGDSVTVAFNGTGMDFIAPLAPNMGSADYYIDGQLQQTVDSYNANTCLQQAVFSSLGLAPGGHVFKAVFKGAADPVQQAASAVNGIVLAVDGFRFYHPIADYTLAGPPSTLVLRLAPGGAVSTTLAVNGLNGYSGDTTFHVSGLPAGVTASFSPASVSGTGTTLLNLSAAAGATAGNAAFTIEGDCGAVRRVTIAALSVTAAQISRPATQGHVHLLWTHASDGQADLWMMSSAGVSSRASYGPYPGWSAKAVSDGSDGATHLLWTKSDGTVSVWNLAAGGSFTQNAYGPYAGWTASALSAGPDGHCHLLWNHTSGQVSLWDLNNTSGAYTYVFAGPYPGWTARAVATDAANDTDLLWSHESGEASLWRINPKDGSTMICTYGAFPGWTVTALSTGPDALAHPLWNSSDGTAGLWSVGFSGAADSLVSYSALSGMTAAASATGPDNLTHLLWNGSGGASVWDIAPDGTFGHTEYGPYSGWNAVAVSAGP